MPRLGTVARRHALGGGNVRGTRGMSSLKQPGGGGGGGTRGMLATWGERLSIGLGGRGKGTWCLRQHVRQRA